MGVDFICNNITFSCRYNEWNNIREEVLRASLKYINDIEIDSDNDYDNFYAEELASVTRLLETTHCVDTFARHIMDEPKRIDALIYYSLYGAYVVCNKSDCEGEYSPGNAFDICETLEAIEPHISPELTPDIYGDKQNNSLYSLFYESYSSKSRISIS